MIETPAPPEIPAIRAAAERNRADILVTPVHCTVAGLMYAHSLRRMATAGMVIAHVAGTEAYRSGYLLSP